MLLYLIMAADSLNKNVHLDSENKDLLETVEEFKLKVFTPDSEIQNLKEGKDFFFHILTLSI